MISRTVPYAIFYLISLTIWASLFYCSFWNKFFYMISIGMINISIVIIQFFAVKLYFLSCRNRALRLYRLHSSFFVQFETECTIPDLPRCVFLGFNNSCGIVVDECELFLCKILRFNYFCGQIVVIITSNFYLNRIYFCIIGNSIIGVPILCCCSCGNNFLYGICMYYLILILIKAFKFFQRISNACEINVPVRLIDTSGNNLIVFIDLKSKLPCFHGEVFILDSLYTFELEVYSNFPFCIKESDISINLSIAIIPGKRTIQSFNLCIINLCFPAVLLLFVVFQLRNSNQI